MARSCGWGVRAVASLKAKSIRARSDLPPLCNARSASAREASTYVGSFRSTSACNGVLVTARLAVHFSRSGASNRVREGGGTVRFHTVYIPRRYRSELEDCV